MNEKIVAEEKQNLIEKIFKSNTELQELDKEVNEIYNQLQKEDKLDWAAYDAACECDYDLLQIARKKERERLLKACRILNELGFEFDSILINGTQIVCEEGKFSIVDSFPF